MAKIKLHNPELAANSKFSNLVVESLNTDPSVTGTINVGRIWFNSTDKTFKATFLNEAGDNLEVKTIGDSSQLTTIENDLAQETADRESADTTLQNNIDTVSTDLATETTNRTNADTTLQNNIDTVSTDLATETTNRTNADDALGARIDNVNTAVGIAGDTYSANGSANFTSTATSLVDADNKLDASLKSEETARSDADDALDTRVTTVENQVNGKIGDLSTLTTDEKGTIVGSINEVDANTDALDTRVTNVENQVNGKIGDLSTLTTDAKDNLVNALNEVDANTDTNTANLATETTNRTNADTTLQNNIDTVSTDLATETTNRTNADTTLQNNIDTLTTDVATNYLNKTSSTDQAVAANTTFQQDLVVAGNLTVSGASTTVETEILKIADNIITLNNGVTGAPTENAGLEVDRGDDGITNILNWNEALDQVEVQEAGELRKVATTNYVDDQVSTINSNSNDLQTELDATQTGAGLGTDGTYTANGSANFISDATTLKDADNKLDTSLKSEETARIDADTTLQNNIDSETSARTSADTTLQNNIDSETSARSDADDALDTRVTNVENQVNGKIGDLSTLTTDEKGTIVGSINEVDANTDTNTTNLATEITNRTNADDALDTRITDLESAVGTNIGDLTTLTTDAKDNLVNALNEVDAHADTNASDLATEITNRTNADTSIQTELDATQTGAGLETDGTYVADALTNYLTEATSLKDADKKLDAQAKTNADDVAAVDARLTTVEDQVNGNIGDLSTLTTDEKGTIVGAINEVDANTDAEVTRATSAEATLTSNLNTEISDRTTADNNLGTRIDNVNTAAGISSDTYTADNSTNFISTATSLVDADNKLDTALKAYQDKVASTVATTDGTNIVGYEGYTEADTNIVNPTIEIDAGTLTNALSDIAGSVNARINEFENRFVKGEVASADKSDTYTIAHNLDTEFVDVSVQVYDEDETVWRFDLVVTEVIDVNTVKISLASGNASQIRYVIKGY